MSPWRHRSGCASTAQEASDASARVTTIKTKYGCGAVSWSSLLKRLNGTMDDLPTPLRCFNECHVAEKFVDDGVESVTSLEQVSGCKD